MLDPGAGKTVKTYIWAYARGEHDHTPGVIYDFCAGRGAKYPMAFLQGWCGTITCDDYRAYDAVLRTEGRTEAGCLAHARRRFDELAKAHASTGHPALGRALPDRAASAGDDIGGSTGTAPVGCDWREPGWRTVEA